tara:strand:+ start:1049 stop:1360 length:312 start_codon:yes stop_codon:yes gene_type:complete
MAATIVAYDIPGSSYTGFIGNNYRKERAVRRFLVDGNGRKDKTTVLEDVIAAIDDDADLNLHIQTVAANANLPLQEATIQRVGRAADGADALWLVEASYYYAI